MRNKMLLTFSVLMCFQMDMNAQVKVLQDVQQQVSVFPQHNGSKAVLSVAQVKTTLSSGKIVDGSLISLYDPKSHIFWWMHQLSDGVADPTSVMKDFLETYTFSVYPDVIACFTASGRTLSARTSQAHVDSLDEGLDQARAALPGKLSEFMSGSFLWFKEIPLAYTVDRSFFRGKNFGDPVVELTVGSASRSDSGWEIRISNDKGESKTISLTRDLQPKSSN